MTNDEFNNICKYIETNANKNKGKEVFIRLSNFTNIKNYEDSEEILKMLKDKFNIEKSNIYGKDHLDIFLKNY